MRGVGAGVEEFDFVIVGAGTAGAALAGLLAERSGATIAVIEAGPPDRNPWIHVPIGFFRTLQDRRIVQTYPARFDTTPAARPMNWPRGAVVGGSGSVNGLVYIQGQREDYADWGRVAGPAWDWPAVAPRFDLLRARGMVSPGPWRHPLADAFIASAGALGFAPNPGFNGAEQAGAGYFEMNTHRGRRASTARRFLHPQLRAGRVHLLTGATVGRVELSEGRATGVRYRRGGQEGMLGARREVILAAGAIGTPQLLQLSGLGPAQVLRRAGVEVLRDLPEVGRGLCDHFAVRTVHRVRGLRTLNEMSRSWFWRAAMGLDYALRRRGPMSIGAAVAGLFAAVTAAGGRPDVQFLMGPLSTDDPARGLHDWPGMTLTYTQSHPQSRGFIEIASADPADPPRIVANYLADARDAAVVVGAMDLARRIMAQDTLARWIAAEHLPGPACRSRDEILGYARQSGGTLYHPCGTVRMGGGTAPLAPDLRLKGVAGLRVADAAAMPDITSGNINAVCAMIAVAACEFLLGRG